MTHTFKEERSVSQIQRLTWLTFMKTSHWFLCMLSSIEFKLNKEKQVTYMVKYKYYVQNSKSRADHVQGHYVQG